MLSLYGDNKIINFFTKGGPIRKLFNTSFTLSIVKLGSGRIIAQLIAFLMTPILSRLFLPKEYGLLGIVTSINAITVVFSTLTYDKAIVLPKEDIKAQALTKIITIQSIIISVIFLFGSNAVISFFPKTINVSGINEILLILPMFILFNVQNIVGKNWAIRKKMFGLIAQTSVVISFTVSFVKLISGLLGLTKYGLVIGTLFGEFAGFFIFFFRISPFRSALISKQQNNIKQIGAEYIEFPKFGFPQNALNIFSRRSPALLLGIFFTPEIVGYFYFGYRMIMLPMELLNESIRSVCLKEIADRINNKKPLKKLFQRSTGYILIIGIVPILMLIILAPQLFTLFFGAAWVKAGIYSRWLSIWVLILFVNIPAVQVLIALKKQKNYLQIAIFTFISRIVGLFIGGILKSDVLAIALFSIAGALNNIIIIFVAFKCVCKFDEKINKIDLRKLVINSSYDLSKG
ncbi:MAG: oligosaccharide flippase family protein [Fibrobacter sp.]|nr:oligosaccharide flippase family protein [Fibrobacter sp.]